MSASGVDISHNKELQLLIKNFSQNRPSFKREVPRWDLQMLLLHLLKQPYEPLAQASLTFFTRQTAVLLTLASAKRGAEVHAFSSQVLFGQNYSNVTLHYIPGFIAKTQILDRPETTMAPVIKPALSATV
jgi:hypothetical protein